jgi:hypothetical protein
MVGCIAWLAIYGTKVVFAAFDLDASWENLVLLCLSDLNSVFLFVACVILIRGDAVDIYYYRAVFFQVLLAIAVVDLGFIACGWQITHGERPELFLQFWSSGLAILIPVVFGRAVSHRYHTSSLLFICTFYGALQPLAYGSVFMPPNRPAVILTSQRVTMDAALSKFVEEVPRGDADFEYRIRQNADGGVLTRKKLDQLLSQFEDYTEGVTRLGVRLHLQFSELVFVLLALLKLAWGAQVLAIMRSRPANVERLTQFCDRPLPHADLVEDWKRYFYGVVVVLACMLVVVVATYGKPLVVVVTAVAGPLALILFAFRHGRPIVRWLEVQLRGDKR